MGDLIHTMPAITDLAKARPDIELHWLVEEGFTDIPLWHPFVKKVHACAIRRWRKSFFKSSTRNEMKALRESLRAENFDWVIDAQGLVKSALMVRWLDCPKHGYDKNSIREPLASFFYSNKYRIDRKQDAISRNRQLFAAAGQYILPAQAADFGLAVRKPDAFIVREKSYALFLHGTNWSSKVWPVQYWRNLAESLAERGLDVLIAWGSQEEKARAEHIAQGLSATVLEKQSLNAMAYLLQHASIVVGSDTGLSHLAGALDTYTVGLYGASSSTLTGLNGRQVHSLQSDYACSPCLKKACPIIPEGGSIPCYERINHSVVVSLLERDQKL